MQKILPFDRENSIEQTLIKIIDSDMITEIQAFMRKNQMEIDDTQKEEDGSNDEIAALQGPIDLTQFL